MHLYSEQALLAQCLRESLGIDDTRRVQEIMTRAQSVSVQAGQYVMRQGDAADAMYLIVSGRLRAQARFDNTGAQLPHPMVFNEMGRGELFGEIGIINQQARTADVLAIRDSILLRMSAQDFLHWLNTTPEVSLAVMRRVIERMSKSASLNAQNAQTKHHVVNICILPITPKASERALNFADTWKEQLSQALMIDDLHDVVRMHGGEMQDDLNLAQVHVINPDSLPKPQQDAVQALRAPKQQISEKDREITNQLLHWLHDQETNSDMQLLVADQTDSEWTRLCIRQADLVVLLADASDDPALTEIEQRYFVPIDDFAMFETRQLLVLIQPEDCLHPEQTHRWLEPRAHLVGTLRESKALTHHHVRLANSHNARADLGRLARIVCGRTVALVLSGGGARGFCEFGILQAIAQAGLPIDMVGGTSIGSIVAGYAALGMHPVQAQKEAGSTFKRNPTKDINWLPMLSVIRGKRLRQFMDEAVRRAFQAKPDVEHGIEDFWIPYFCIASNYSQVRMQVLRRGSVAKSMTASAAIPAALPPTVWDGDLLFDGGIFNNYPVDVMRSQGARWILGVNLDVTHYRKLTIDIIPHPVHVLWDRWMRPKAKQRYRGVPNIATTVFNTTVLASIEHQQRMDEQVDIVFKPPLKGIGMLDWQAFDKAVESGFIYGQEVLAKHGFKH